MKKTPAPTKAISAVSKGRAGELAGQSTLIQINVYQGLTHSLLENDTRETATQVLYDVIDWINRL